MGKTGMAKGRGHTLSSTLISVSLDGINESTNVISIKLPLHKTRMGVYQQQVCWMYFFVSALSVVKFMSMISRFFFLYSPFSSIDHFTKTIFYNWELLQQMQHLISCIKIVEQAKQHCMINILVHNRILTAAIICF